MFGRRSGVESILHALSRIVSSFVGRGVSLTRPVLESVSSFVGRGVSLTLPVLESVWSFFGTGSLSDTTLAVICLVVRRWGVSLTRPVFESVT